MLSILTAVFGFAAPFLPELLKYFNRKADNAHELKLLELQIQGRNQEHMWRMEEINAQADIAEAVELHKPTPSTGVQILDAARDNYWPKGAVIPVFLLFSLLDFLAGMVRPTITYAAFIFYAAYKWAIFHELTTRFANDAAGALSQMWGENDWAVLTLVLSYYFGTRSYKATFGGNASHGQAGK